MNITFMIGNGFDINLGLKTSYADFLDHYLSQPDGSGVIGRFKQSIAREMETWTDVEIALGQCTRDFFGDTASADFLACYDDLYDRLAAYLAQQESHAEALGEEKLREAMAFALSAWQKGFRRSRSQEIARRIALCGGGFSFNFITFNYTRTIDTCLDAVQDMPLGTRVTDAGEIPNSLGRSVHVHGYTNKDMILGVNDESQLANPLLLMDRLVFERDRIVKQKANRLFEEGTDELAHSVLKDSDLVYIYGMSLGKTDKLWWQRLGQLMADRPHVQVIIHRHDAPADDLHYHRFLAFENEVQRKLLSHCGRAPEDALSRIHVTGFNIFGQLQDLAAGE